MKKEKRSPLGLYTIGIAALFLAGFFLLVVFGAQSYRNTSAGQNENMHRRALLSYFPTTLKAYDAENAISVHEEPEFGQILVLRDGNSGYAVRVYLADGVLVEDYAPEDSALRPEEAQRIGETECFEVRKLPGKALKITTDEGSILLHLRSGEDAE